MSFKFEWPTQACAREFAETAKRALSQALNSGKRPTLVSDQILVQDFNLGSIPPELDLMTIEELSTDGSFKGRFMLSYNGDASISLATHVQVNPLTQYKHALELLSTPSALLQTAQMFVELTLSQLRLRCVIVVAFSKKHGLTLAFKDDPLESLTVSSSFDSIGVIHSFIQTEIEHQLRERFRRDLPSLIHRLSQHWLADMGQHPPSPGPIHIEREQQGEREREPDDSFHDGSFSFVLSEEEDERAQSPPALGSSSESEESDGQSGSDTDGEGDTTGEEAGEESDGNEELSISPPPRPASPAAIVSHSPPKKSTLRRSSSSAHSIPRDGKNGNSADRATDSPILRSLQRSDSTFATTFSRPLHLEALPPELTASLLGPGPATADRRATRTRLHRLDSPSPQTSPVKPRQKSGQGHRHAHERQHSSSTTRTERGEKMRIRKKEFDEYFPIQHESDGKRDSKSKGRNQGRGGGSPLDSSGPIQAHPPMSSRIEFGTAAEQAARDRAMHQTQQRLHATTMPSLRRSMMSNRLRDADYFAPSYPPPR